MPESHFISAPDGLKLHARLWGAPVAGKTPLLCLPGLSRNTMDFDVIAEDIARERQVLAFDYRGRGLSGWDPKFENYSYPVELADITAMATALGVHRAVVLGTSRGGIHALLLTAARPGLLAGVILNDIGPVVDGRGLARIKSYLGKIPTPANHEEGARLLKSLADKQFPSASDADWRRQAEAVWFEKDGKLAFSFDPGLAKSLEAMNFDQPIPTLWPQFDGLAGVPTMVIRGEHSDILAVETVREMAARRPDLETMTVPGQGHAPFLTDQPTIGRIAAFCRHCDAGKAH